MSADINQGNPRSGAATRALISAVPVPRPGVADTRLHLLGEVPSPLDRPNGCAFHPRCQAALSVCRSIDPQLAAMGDHHLAACHNPI